MPKVTYTIVTNNPEGYITGASKTFTNEFVPQTDMFRITLGIPREAQDDLELNFVINSKLDGCKFNPETEEVFIDLDPSPYLLEDGSWEEDGYDSFSKDMISLCMTRGWKLWLVPGAPEELKCFT